MYSIHCCALGTLWWQLGDAGDAACYLLSLGLEVEQAQHEAHTDAAAEVALQTHWQASRTALGIEPTSPPGTLVPPKRVIVVGAADRPATTR